MKVKLIVDGGSMKPGPSVSQQLGPMGVNLGKVISDVNEATKGFAGIKVPVELDVNPKTKSYKIQVFSPPVSELIKKELKLEKGSGTPNKIKVGNIPIEILISIAKTKMPDLLAKDLKSALKLIVGSCVSAGILIDSKEAKEIEIEISAGNYDSEISQEKTSPSPEKVKELESFFKKLQSEQEARKKAEEEAEKAAEAAKEAKAAAAGKAPAEGKAVAETGAAKSEEAPSKEAKAPEEKKKS